MSLLGLCIFHFFLIFEILRIIPFLKYQPKCMGFIKRNLLLFFVVASSFSSFSQKIDFRSDSLDMKQILKGIFVKNDSAKKKEPSKIAFSLIPAPDLKSA